MEVTDTYKEGYWVERNWDETAQVRTTSVIDTVAVEQIIERGGQQYITHWRDRFCRRTRHIQGRSPRR